MKTTKLSLVLLLTTGLFSVSCSNSNTNKSDKDTVAITDSSEVADSIAADSVQVEDQLQDSVPSKEEIKEFAENFKKNIKIKMHNSLKGTEDEEMGNDGSEWKVTNNNPFMVSGKDYTLSFKLYNWGEYLDKRKTKGKDLPANGSVIFNETLELDGMMLKDATIRFNITDEEIYAKYHRQ